MDAPHVSGLGGTYGGNPVACAAALATIETIELDGLLDRAKHIETVMKDKLHRMQADDDRIGDVRARGAMIAVELVKSGTAEPDPERPRRCAAGRTVRCAGAQLRHLRQHPPVPAAADHQRRVAARGPRRAGRHPRRDLTETRTASRRKIARFHWISCEFASARRDARVASPQAVAECGCIMADVDCCVVGPASPGRRGAATQTGGMFGGRAGGPGPHRRAHLHRGSR